MKIKFIVPTLLVVLAYNILSLKFPALGNSPTSKTVISGLLAIITYELIAYIFRKRKRG